MHHRRPVIQTIADASQARHRHALFVTLGYAAGRQARPQTALAEQIHAVMP